MAHIIVLGNEKGGSGKSTTAMHVAISLLARGVSVGVVDLDARQRTLSRYLENRQTFAEENSLSLAMPQCRVVARSELAQKAQAEADEAERFGAAMAELESACAFVVIDCPGSDSHLSRLAHGRADTLITPVNDSFVDLDLLAKVNPETFEVVSPSLYSEMVWEGRKRRAIKDRGTIDWVVLRNRVASLDARNKRRVGGVLEKLAKRIGFRFVPGFGERVIYRELFLKGLTLLDLRDQGGMTLSHVAARQEVRSLIEALHLPGLNAAAAE